MSRVERIYGWLAAEQGPEADRILAAGLEHAESLYADRIVAILLGRATEAAWAGLVANYDHLSPEARRQLHDRPGLLRPGITAALKWNTARGRQNALGLLASDPCPPLLYLAADLLRDDSAKVRELAAQVLRGSAERTLSSELTVAAADRAALVDALREALRTFERHHQLDVLETCLWFAKDLGEHLWDVLSAPRCGAGHAVAQHLETWDHPRLAGFLLLALGRPAWRRPAHQMLNSWSTRSELLAMLQNTDLLADPLVCQNLHLLKWPRWLAAAGPNLEELPPEARAQVPHWICHLGFTDQERVHCLKLWQASAQPEVQRAAVYALAALHSPEANRALAEVAAQPGPLARFAAWCIAGRQALPADGRQWPHPNTNPAQNPFPRTAATGVRP
jgi:hypothetical protein